MSKSSNTANVMISTVLRTLQTVAGTSSVPRLVQVTNPAAWITTTVQVRIIEHITDISTVFNQESWFIWFSFESESGKKSDLPTGNLLDQGLKFQTRETLSFGPLPSSALQLPLHLWPPVILQPTRSHLPPQPSPSPSPFVTLNFISTRVPIL